MLTSDPAQLLLIAPLSLTLQKKLEKAVHDALNVNGDNAGYAYWIAGEDGRYKLAQWCDTSSPRSKGIVGQYPDPANKPDDLPENFSWGVKF